MANPSEAPSVVLAEHATEMELERWFVGASAFSLPPDATFKLRSRVTAIRRRLLVQQVALCMKCYYCGKPSVAVLIEAFSQAHAFCVAHVPLQFKTKGAVDYDKSTAGWCGHGGHFGLMSAERYLRCLCGPFRTDSDGRYFSGSNFFDVGDGVHVVLAGDGAVTSQGVNTSPVVSSQAPEGLTKEELNTWCDEEIERLIEAVIAETGLEVLDI